MPPAQEEYIQAKYNNKSPLHGQLKYVQPTPPYFSASMATHPKYMTICKCIQNDNGVIISTHACYSHIHTQSYAMRCVHTGRAVIPQQKNRYTVYTTNLRLDKK